MGYILRIKRTGFWSLCGAVSQQRPHMQPSSPIPGERVWCVSNSVGTLITRRRGKVAIVGNCLGRMIRIGSKHDSVLAIHLAANFKGGGIDKHVLGVINSKMKLIEAVLGERLKGTTRGEGEAIKVTSEVNDIFDAMREEAKGQ